MFRLLLVFPLLDKPEYRIEGITEEKLLLILEALEYSKINRPMDIRVENTLTTLKTHIQLAHKQLK